MEEFIQKTKVGVAGSVINQLMGNNNRLPEVGKGATVMHYTDRDCYEVISVSKCGKIVVLEELEAKADTSKNLSMGHQEWILTPTGIFKEVRWRHNAWRMKSFNSCTDKYDYIKISILFGVKDYYYDWSF